MALFSNKAVNSVLKIMTTINNTELMNVAINKERAKRFKASEFFSGSIIAISYRPVTKIARMLVILRYKAKTPKSSGEYILVKIGVIAIGIACAIVVPVIRVIMLL